MKNINTLLFYMNFLSSILIGTEGSYTFLGQSVTFKENVSSIDAAANSSPKNYASGSSSSIYQIISLKFAHDLIHELGHALTNYLFTRQSAEINIYTAQKDIAGSTGSASCPGLYNLSDWKISVVYAAGPIANMAFSIGKLVLINFLKTYLAWPIVVLITLTTIHSIAQEIFYAIRSYKSGDGGDFSCIAKKSPYHLLIASAVLISQAALGILLFKANIRIPE